MVEEDSLRRLHRHPFGTLSIKKEDDAGLVTPSSARLVERIHTVLLIRLIDKTPLPDLIQPLVNKLLISTPRIPYRHHPPGIASASLFHPFMSAIGYGSVNVLRTNWSRDYSFGETCAS